MWSFGDTIVYVLLVGAFAAIVKVPYVTNIVTHLFN
jgi:hypothetical protein